MFVCFFVMEIRISKEFQHIPSFSVAVILQPMCAFLLITKKSKKHLVRK